MIRGFKRRCAPDMGPLRHVHVLTFDHDRRCRTHDDSLTGEQILGDRRRLTPCRCSRCQPTAAKRTRIVY